jgi:hypothetical protein
MNLYAAQTGSANIFTANQTINANLSVSGNTTIGGTLVVAGRLTAEEFHSEITTASVIYSSGSTKFGDDSADRHEFTGSIYAKDSIIIGTEVLGNAGLNAFTASAGSQLSRIYQATASLQQATSSLQAHSASVNAQLERLQQTTQSLHVATASLQAFSSSVNSQLERVYQTTQSLHVATASLQEFSSSVNDQLQRVYQTTQSLHVATASLQQFTASQDSRNFTISQITASFAGEIGGLEAYSASLKAAAIVSSSTQVQNYDVFALNSNLYTSTGSLIGITNGLMAFTASLDNTYATDAQLYQLYQATRSLELLSGSMIGITNGLMAYTSSNETWKTGVRDEVNGIESYTSSLKAAISVSGTNVQIIGDLNVNKLNVQYVSSSVLVTSGSNIFGDQSTDKHEFTGSVGVTGNLIGASDIQANKFVFTDGVVNTNVGGQKILATNSNILYLYTGTSGLYINNQANNAQNVTITDAGVVTTRGGVQIGSSGNDQNLVFGGTNSSIYWGVGGPARMYYNVGDIKISSNGASDVLTVKNIGGVEISGGITGSLMATNGVVSGSQQITEYNRFAQTSSANTFYGDQTITGSLAIKDSETNFLIEGNGFSQTYLSSNGAIVLNPGYGGVEMVGSYRTFKATDITADGFVSGEIRATNNVVSSSQQITEYNTFAVTSSANTFYGNQTISGSLRVTAPIRTNIISGGLDVNGGITGSFKGNLSGVADFATTVVVTNSGTTTDTSLFPIFSLSPVLASYTSLYSHASSSFFYNGVTRRLHMEGFVVSGSNNIAEISGSLNVTGSILVDGLASAKTMYVGGATTSTGLIGASEAVVQNELGIQYGDATGTYMRLIANAANSNTAIQAGAFSGANPSLDLIASEGTTAISIKNYGGVTFNGAVTSSQSVSVGTGALSSPNGADRFVAVYSGQDSGIVLQDSVETWEMYMNDDLYFTTGSTNPKNVMSLRRVTGNVEINEGNLVIGKAGKGIDFSATSDGSGTTTSELLNDYEEGTWTPVIRGANTAGTYELTHVSHYTKIGRQVTLTSRINMAGSITGGGVGYMQIQGLPFAKGENVYAIGACDVIGCDTTGNYLTVQFISLGAGSTLFLSETNDNAASTDFPISGLSASDSIGIGITYFV